MVSRVGRTSQWAHLYRLFQASPRNQRHADAQADKLSQELARTGRYGGLVGVGHDGR